MDMARFDDSYAYDNGADDDGSPRSFRPYCKYCRSEEVEWVHSGVRWRLYDADAMTLHSCGRTASVDDFDVC